MIRPRTATLIILVALHLGLTWLWAIREAPERQDLRRTELTRRLEAALAVANPASGYSRLMKDLYPILAGQVADPVWLNPLLRSRLPGSQQGICFLTLFDAKGKELWSDNGPTVPAADFTERAFPRVIKRYQLLPPPFRVIHIREHPTWLGIWMTWREKRPEAGKISSLLLLVNHKVLPRDFLLRQAVADLQKQGWEAGYLNQVFPGQSRLPAGLSIAEATALAEESGIQSEKACTAEGGLLSIVPSQGDLLLLGLVPRQPPVFPRWSMGLLFVWLPLVWRATLGESGKRLSLPVFLPASIALAAGIPLLVTMAFLGRFAQNQMDSRVAKELAEMGQRLIHIDNQYPAILLKRQREFHQAVQRVNNRTWTLEQLRRALDVMELSNVFDNGFLVSSQAILLRDYSHMHPAYRAFFLLPRKERPKRLQELIDAGFSPAPNELKLMTSLDPGTGNVQSLWDFKAGDPTQIKKVMTAIARILIERFNAPESPAAQENPASMLYGGLLESQGGDILQKMLGNMGSFDRMGGGTNQIEMFMEMITGGEKAANHVLLTVQNIIGLELAFLRDIFGQLPLQADGVSIYAQSPGTSFYFPPNDHPDLLASFGAALTPSRRLHGEVSDFRGQPSLIVAYACRNMANFTLFAVKPWAPLGAGRLMLIAQMTGTLALVMVLLWVVAWRLREGVLRPAVAILDGVRAMERKTFEHRIAVTSGDEWAELADAFNHTLETMEELEVARIIQTKLFPAKKVESSAGTLIGKCVMTQEVGGDYFDAIAMADGSLVFIIGDVTGHGVSAALVVAMAKSAFGHLVKHAVAPSPAEILDRMSSLFREHLRKTKVMTCQMGWLTPERTLRFANAGHLYPYLLLPDGKPTPVEQPGIPLGMVRARHPYTDLVISLPVGARLFLFTDGVVEARSPGNQAFSFLTLKQTVTDLQPLGSDALIEAILARIRTFTAETPWEDDVSLAVMEVKSPD